MNGKYIIQNQDYEKCINPVIDSFVLGLFCKTTEAIRRLLVLLYLRIGTKAADETVSGMKESRTRIDDAKQAVDALNKSNEETKKAIENATGAGEKYGAPGDWYGKTAAVRAGLRGCAKSAY